MQVYLLLVYHSICCFSSLYAFRPPPCIYFTKKNKKTSSQLYIVDIISIKLKLSWCRPSSFLFSAYTGQTSNTCVAANSHYVQYNLFVTYWKSGISITFNIIYLWRIEQVVFSPITSYTTLFNSHKLEGWYLCQTIMSVFCF